MHPGALMLTFLCPVTPFFQSRLHTLLVPSQDELKSDPMKPVFLKTCSHADEQALRQGRCHLLHRVGQEKIWITGMHAISLILRAYACVHTRRALRACAVIIRLVPAFPCAVNEGRY